MKKMKAYTLVNYGRAREAFQLREKEVPAPGEQEVLIQVEGFGLNFADVLARQGLYQDAPPLPAVLGYDVVGKVIQTGTQVRRFQPGDRVVALTRFGGYAEYALTHEFACAKIKSDVPVAEACALATQFCTAQYMIETKMKLMPGDRVLVHSGAGGVGSALIQLAKRKEAVVIATVGSSSKTEIASRLGADSVIHLQEEDFQKSIETRFGKKPLQAVFDAIGGKNFRKSLKLLGPGGTICAYGVAENTKAKGGPLLIGIQTLLGFGFLSPPLMMMDGKSFAGVNMLRVADHQPLLFQALLKSVIELYESGAIRPLVDPKNQGLYSAQNLAEAHEALENRKTIGKIAVTW